MKLQIYFMRDAKADAFLAQPIIVPTPGMAERQFLDILRNENSFFAKHAADFSLWHVGYFDDKTGKLEASSPAELVTGPQVLSLMKEA